MASPNALRELRVLIQSSFSAGFTDASSAPWAADTALKLRVQNYDPAGLVRQTVPDTSIKQRCYATLPPIVTTTTGTFSFSQYLGGADATVAVPTEASMLSAVMGGIASPTTERAGAIAASGVGTTTKNKLYISDVDDYVVAGQAVLVGTRGDTRGNGEVRRIATVGEDYVTLDMDLLDVPDEADVVTYSTTCYLDPDATQSYFDTLAIGKATDDQVQCIGCQATGLALSGGGFGELPSASYTMTAAAHQPVPSGERDQMEPTQASLGADPPVYHGHTGFFLGDYGTATRTVFKGGPVDIPALLAGYAPETSMNGVNGIGGWTKTPPPDGISANFTLLRGQDMPGLADDLTNATAKQLLVQYGSAATQCVAVSLARCYVAADPVPSELEGNAAVDVTVMATETTLATNDLTLAAVAIHIF